MADRAWVALIERACEERLISPVFQPIVDCARGVVCGYEGLTRFPAGPGASPQDWFAAAALHGLAGRLEAAALEAILGHRSQLPANCFLSVNLSPDALIAPEVEEVLAHAGALDGVVVEITEQTPVEDYAVAVAALDGMRRRGAAVAVDDTGTGYASLSHLLVLRPDFVKLDRALVSGVDRDPRLAAAVSAIGAFAGELDAWLVAEGVETAAELERLIDLRVPLVQGYLLGRPDREMARPRPAVVSMMRHRGARTADPLGALATPARTTVIDPERVAETTVLVDDFGRPQCLIVPDGGRRTSRHPAMCVGPGDEIADVALRAIARRSEDRHGPVCLCDERGRFVGTISIDALLEHLAREARGRG